MDISTVEAGPREVQIINPKTYEPIGLTITVLPGSHPKVKDASRKLQNARLAQRNQKITAEQLEANGLTILLAHIESWKWDEGVTFGGEKLEFNEASVRKVLKKDWIRRQVDEAAGDEAAFFQS